jgi:hypothetical protein
MSGRDVHRAVLGQIDVWWEGFFRPHLNGLTDEELMWCPAPGCWTLHPREDGLVSYDFAWPPPQPSPVTTIAWRMCHITVFNLANRTLGYFGESVPTSSDLWERLVAWRSGPDGKYNFDRVPFSLSADAAVAMLDECWRMWRSGVVAAGEEGLWREIGPEEHDFGNMQLGEADPFIGVVLHVHREMMHHGAEINLLRDLYRAKQGHGV